MSESEPFTPGKRGRKQLRPDPAAGPVAAFAHRLCELKEAAGDPSYDRMRGDFGAAASKSALSSAARGQDLPSWETTWEFVRSLAVGVLGEDAGATRGEWSRRWEQAREDAATQFAADGTATPGSHAIGLVNGMNGTTGAESAATEGTHGRTVNGTPTGVPYSVPVPGENAAAREDGADSGNAAFSEDATSPGEPTPPEGPTSPEGAAAPEVPASPKSPASPADAASPEHAAFPEDTATPEEATPPSATTPPETPDSPEPPAGRPAARERLRRTLLPAGTAVVVTVAVIAAATYLLSDPQRPIPGDNSLMVDENLLDGTQVQAGRSFVKTWDLRNAGDVPWSGRYLEQAGPPIGDSACTAPKRVWIPDVQPGHTVRVAVPVNAGDEPGRCKIAWKMVDESGRLFFPENALHPVFFDWQVVR